MTLHVKCGEFNVAKRSEAQSKIRLEVTETPSFG